MNSEHHCKDPKCKTCEKQREVEFRAWWAGLSREQRLQEIRAGHVRARFPEPPEKTRTPNQLKAARRAARGKRVR